MQGRPLFTRHCPKNGQKKKARTSVPYADEILRFFISLKIWKVPELLCQIFAHTPR